MIFHMCRWHKPRIVKTENQLKFEDYEKHKKDFWLKSKFVNRKFQGCGNLF